MTGLIKEMDGKKKEVREKGRDEDSEEKEAAIKKNYIALKKKKQKYRQIEEQISRTETMIKIESRRGCV